MAALDIINRINQAPNRIAKEQVLLDAWITGEREYFIAAQLAGNFDINFKVTSVPRIDDSGEDDTFVPTFTFNDFLILTKKLRMHACTSEQAKVLINSSVVQASTLEWNNVYRDVLRRSWHIEFKMINKILRKLSLSDPNTLKYLIAELKLQEYHEADMSKINKLRGDWMLEAIPSGFPCCLVLNREQKTAIVYFPSTTIATNQNICDFTNDLTGIFDSLPCNMAIHCINGSYGQYHMIDCMPLSDYYKCKCNIPQRDRHTILSGVIGIMLTLLGDTFKVVQKLNVDLDTDTGRRNLQEFIDTNDVAWIGIKDATAPYEFNSKKKSWIEFDRKL